MSAIKIKQKEISMKQYEILCNKIIAKKYTMENTLIALLEVAIKYKIKIK